MIQSLKHNTIVVFNDREKARTSISLLWPALQESFRDKALHTVNSDGLDDLLTSDMIGVLVAPGIVDEDSFYHEVLDEKRMKYVQNFVENGGVLVTVCGGSSRMFSESLWTPSWREKDQHKTRDNSAPLIDGRAHAPVPGMDAKPIRKDSELLVMPMKFKTLTGEWKSAGMAYGNGPAFYPRDPHDPNFEPLIRYDVPDEPVAAALLKRGKGLVVLLGPLPYVNARMFASYGSSIEVPFEKRALARDLRINEPARTECWNEITGRIRRHLKTLAPS